MPRYHRPLSAPQRAALDALVLRTGVLSRDKLYPAANELGVSRRVLMEQYLRPMPAWQQARPPPPPARFGVISSVIAHEPQRYLQVDLGHVAKYGANNAGYKYLLVAVDVYSKRVWIRPLKNATAAQTTQAFRTIADTLPELEVVQTDHGEEFRGAFDAYLDGRGIRHVRSKPGVPQSNGGVEKAVGIVKGLVERWVHLNGNRSYVLHLPEIEEGYNQRVHSTTGVPPEVLDRRELVNIAPATRRRAAARTAKQLARTARKRMQWPDDLDMGDLVRLYQPSKNPLTKAWEVRWSEQTYPVTGVRWFNEALGVKMYRLGGLEGIWPRRHLQKVVAPVGLSFRDFGAPVAAVREQREAEVTAAEAAAFVGDLPTRRVRAVPLRFRN